MPRNFFQPKAGRYGTVPLVVSSGQIGGSNYLGGTVPFTASGTTTFVLPAPSFRCRFKNFSVWCVTIPVSAGGTLLASVLKQNAGTATTVSADVDLTTLTAQAAKVGAILGTATEAGLSFNGTSDAVQINVVSNAAIGTQPVSLAFAIYFEML